jgi:hypothetical protein
VALANSLLIVGLLRRNHHSDEQQQQGHTQGRCRDTPFYGQGAPWFRPHMEERRG